MNLKQLREDFLSRNIDSVINIVYVLKGFEGIDIGDNRLSRLIDDDIHRKQYAKESSHLLISLIEKLKTGAAFYLKYSEFLLLLKEGFISNLKALNYSMRLIDFNFFNQYYLTEKKQLDYKFINESINQSSDNLIQDIFTFADLHNDLIIYSLNSVEFSFEKIIKLNSANSQNIEEISDSNSTVIRMDLSELDFIKEIINNLSKTQIVFNFDVKELNIRNKQIVANLFSLDIKIFKSTSEKEEINVDTEDYRYILQRIDPNYDFRTLEVYKNPESNLEIERISQVVIIDDIYKNIQKSQASGDYRDIFMTAPTGSGKSVVFQVPAIKAAEDYGLVTIVISPLIGLMNDQVDNIKKMTDLAVTINSDYTPEEKDTAKNQIISGEKSILYISPETLLSNANITNLIGDRQLGMVVIDEAHTVATWGKSFRPDYWFLGDHLRTLRKYSEKPFIISAFTATAVYGGPEDMIYEIQNSLFMTIKRPYIGKVTRTDLAFEIINHEVTTEYKANKEEKVFQSLVNEFEENHKTLVYFPFIRHLNDYYERFPAKYKRKISRYYSNLDRSEKAETLISFKEGEKSMVLATKAFGMGIDIDDINTVYHFAPTGNLADYVQEIGRAARKPSISGKAKTDYFKNDFRYIKQLYGLSRTRNFELVAVAQKILSIYKKSGMKNILVSSEKFSHIFDAKDSEDIDGRLKTALLVLKRDIERDEFLNDYSLIFKPRSMFTRGLFLIPDEHLSYFKQIGWMKFLEKYNSKESFEKNLGYERRTFTGDVYELDFKNLWESQYKDISFSSFKHNFYNNELENIDLEKKIIQKIALEIEASSDELLGDSVNHLNQFFDIFENIIDEFKKEGKHFTLNQFSKVVLSRASRYVKNSYQSDMVSNSLLMMINKMNFTNNFGSSSFMNYNLKTNKYEIKNVSYKNKIRSLKTRAFKEITKKYSGFHKKEFLINTKYHSKTLKQNPLLIIAQILEILGVANYSIISGNQPEFFIRINSDYALKKIIETKGYESKTLQSVANRHYNSIEIMDYFFTKLNDTQSRWSLIEQYFLGMDIINSIQDKEITS